MQPEPLQTPKATLTVLSRIEAVDEELQRLAQCCVLLGHHSANVAFDEDQQTIPEIGDFWITQRHHRGALLGRRRGEELDEEDLPKEDGALVIIFKEFIFLIVKYRLAVEVVFVVDKIYLKLRIRNGSYFNDQWFLLITYGNVDAR